MLIRIIAIIYGILIFAIAGLWDNYYEQQDNYKSEIIELTISEEAIEDYLKEHQEEEYAQEYKYFF